MDLFPSQENDPVAASTSSGYGREVIDEVWNRAETIPGNDDALWRKDANGTWINRQDYGKRGSQFGWEIQENGAELRPVHCESAEISNAEGDGEEMLLF